MSDQPKSISAGVFKSRCLSVIDDVANTGQPIIVTKGGRPIAKVIATDRRRRTNLRGSVTFHGDIVEPVLRDWDIDQ